MRPLAFGVLVTAVSVAALADKPEHAGGAKAMPKDARQQHEKMMNEGMDRRHEAEERATRQLEQQREKKMEQPRKEMDKGSEKGQQMREEHSKKWWRFWE